MLRVLVVDDNHAVADSMVLLIREFGNDAHCAYSGADAISVLPVYRPHVVLIDIQMPDMDGWETARRIRALPGSEYISLVAVTGDGQPQDRHESEAAGFDHHFVKPFDVDALESLLKSIDLMTAR